MSTAVEVGKLRHPVLRLQCGPQGWEGFVLEKFTGTGSLFVAGAGNFIDILQSVSMVALARTLYHAGQQASTEGTSGSIKGLLGGSTD
jgi:hypothetical protein